MKNFHYYAPGRIHFGAGDLEQLGAIVRLYGKRCLLVTTTSEPPLDRLFDRVKRLLQEAGVEVFHFDQVTPNPDMGLINKGKVFAEQNSFEVVLAVGGGSTIDVGKMLAFLAGRDVIDWADLFQNYAIPFGRKEPCKKGNIPVIAVPTTSGTGSQVTQCAVISEGNEKHDIFDGSLIPVETVIDPELMCTLPAGVTASSGFDAFCHACESYLSPLASPMSGLCSESAMRLIVTYLPKVLQEPENLAYREQMALADLYAGLALANAGAFVAHPLCELLGTAGRMSHGQSLAALFDSVLEKKYDFCTEKSAAVTRICLPGTAGLEDDQAAAMLPEAIRSFQRKINMDVTLADFQVEPQEIERVLLSPVLAEIPFTDPGELAGILTAALKKAVPAKA